MISHHQTTIFLSSPAKCPNFFPIFLVACPRTRPQEAAVLSNLHLHLHHHRPLLLASRKEVVGPAVFLQQRDEDDEHRTSTSLSARENGESEASAALEDEITDFMLKSPNPSRFPTKKELIAAGRMDLVEAIAAQGGWLAYGWDLDEEPVDTCGDGPSVNGIGSHSTERAYNDSFFLDDSRVFQQRFTGSSASDWEDSVASLSSSGRSIEMEAAQVTGIDAILSGIEKERSFLYAVESSEKEGSSWISGKRSDKNRQRISTDAVAGSERSSRSGEELNVSGDVHFQNESLSNSNGMRSYLKPEMWRMWSAQRAGFPETEFEAAEIVPFESGKKSALDHNSSSEVAANDDTCPITDSTTESRYSRHPSKELYFDDKETFRSHIHARVQQMQSELSSVLHLLRSRTGAVLSQKVERGSLEELHKLSDAWEFQETEIMKTRDKLRSMRAKLAVLEGKMALEAFEVQKIVEERQKRIDGAQKALRILRTACIVWPNSASEVFLVGSFDGWTSQRRMERSSAGIFSLILKLYPGRYEIKFVVDGVWRIDPLRPVVSNNGYDNNLLIIS